MSLPERQDLHAGALALLAKQSEGQVALPVWSHADKRPTRSGAALCAGGGGARGRDGQPIGESRRQYAHRACVTSPPWCASFPTKSVRSGEQLSYDMLN